MSGLDGNNQHSNQGNLGQQQSGQQVGLGEQPTKSASPVMTATKAQADDATFRIVGDAGALFGALALAQGAFLPITKNRTVTVRPRDKPAYTFDYATLDQVLAACVPALSANGLALLQPFYHGPNGLEIRTILAHSSGARLESVTELPKTENIQGAGSALTYLKRYQVQAILGVSSEEDDDGNAADGNQVQNSQPRDRSKPPAPPNRPQQSAASTKAPSKPQDAPKPQPSAPSPPPVETPLQGNLESATELLPTADHLAEMKSLFQALQFKGAGAIALVKAMTGKEHTAINDADCLAVSGLLGAAKEAKWNAEQVALLLAEPGMCEPGAALKALLAEESFVAGS